MVLTGARVGLGVVAIAGGWWFSSCITGGCSVLTSATTGTIMGGFLAALVGTFLSTQGERVANVVGFGFVAMLSFLFAVVEAGGAPIVLLGSLALAAGAALAAWASAASVMGPARRVALVRIGLAIAGAGTLTWGVEKLFAPDWDLPPYLLAPLGLLLAAAAWHARPGEPPEHAATT